MFRLGPILEGKVWGGGWFVDGEWTKWCRSLSCFAFGTEKGGEGYLA